MREQENAADLRGYDMRTIYRRRRDRVRMAMDAAGLDALLVSHAANRFYLSGFELHDGQPGESAGMIVITRSGRDWLATDDRFAETAAALWDENHIYLYGGKRGRTIANLLPQCGYLVGFETQAVSDYFIRALSERCGSRVQFVPTLGIIDKFRMIKEPCEVAALERSYALNHAMLRWLRERLESGCLTGMSEKQLAWQVESFFRENGASELAFPVIAASGKNGATPHAVPGSAQVLADSPLLVDVGCRLDSYCSDQTRTWWNGQNPGADFSRCLALVQEAQARAIAMIRPGVRCADVYKAANDVFEEAGVAHAFTHGLGHGVGLETHEAPSLSPKSDAVLLQGMTVTVEPGLYYPEWGGVRWEHTVLVEADGARVL